MPESKTTFIDLGRWTVDSKRFAYSNLSYPVLPYSGTDGRKAAKEAKLREALAEGIVILSAPTATVGFIQQSGRSGFLPSFLRYGMQGLSLQELQAKIEVSEQNSTLQNSTLASAVRVFFRDEAQHLEAKAKKEKLEKESQKEANWIGPLRLMVPEIGTQLLLSQDWKFRLYQETRNSSVISLFNLFEGRIRSPFHEPTPEPEKVKILGGSILVVDRIYVRQQLKGYSSLSFFLQPQGRLQYKNRIAIVSKRMRFWAKLEDVNQITASVNRLTVPGS